MTDPGRRERNESELCSCGNRFDGDNLCMKSACQWEGVEPDPDAFGAAGYLLTADPGRSGGEGTGHHFHGIVAGLTVVWPDDACASDHCGTPVIVLDPVTARDTIARALAGYTWMSDQAATDVIAALASQERGE
jgi:hypothetical protein